MLMSVYKSDMDITFIWYLYINTSLLSLLHAEQSQLSAFSHRRGTPVPLLWERTSRHGHISCMGESRSGPSTQGMAIPVLSRGNGHLPWPASSALLNSAQDAVGLLGGHIVGLWWIFLFFCEAAFQLVSPHHVELPMVIPPKVQESAFLFVDIHKIPVCLLLQPIEILPNSGRTIQNHPSTESIPLLKQERWSRLQPASPVVSLLLLASSTTLPWWEHWSGSVI